MAFFILFYFQSFFMCLGASKQRSSPLQVAEHDLLPPFHPYQPLECIVEETEGKLNELGQRISAIEKAQLQSLELIQGEPLTKDKIEELKKSREEQVQKKKKILKELQKVERQLQLKTQQQFTKEYMEAKGLKEDSPELQQPPLLAQQCSDGEDVDQAEEEDDLPDEDFSKLPQVDTILYRESQSQQQLEETPPPIQTGFIPIQPLPVLQSTDFSINLESPNTNTPDLQRVMVNQQMLGQQQLAGLGQGLLTQAPDGLMVATPAQTLTDTLDDIMAGGLRLFFSLFFPALHL